ncbi:hypothetical protein DEO72_LG10g1901 [Vigna unguiculata]|uniref:Uncharacterized protein n=1 Tax=Vigna unguiculata TaxID=3917 RepID=A0A4D6N9W9_VIGUN|nr:hypothetical protein DEO72_LG10g1901 [Vigna unguiculata]
MEQICGGCNGVIVTAAAFSAATSASCFLQDEDDGCSVAHGFAGAVDLLQVGGARRWKMVMVVRETSFHGGAACSGSQVRGEKMVLRTGAGATSAGSRFHGGTVVLAVVGNFDGGKGGSCHGDGRR